MNHHRMLLLAAGLLLPACGSTTVTTDTVPNEADHEALAACGASACDSGFAQKIEGDNPFTINKMACIVQAMRDRTPGLYSVELDHTWGNGSESAEITLFITPSGEVEIAVRRTEDYEGEQTVTLEPTERCSLAPATFFEDCLTAVNAGDQIESTEEAWACIYPGSEQKLPWFEGCEAQAPTCE